MIFAVFVSGPYSNNIEENVKNSIDAADKLISMGLLPLVPHMWYYHDKFYEHDYNTWLKLALALLERADALLRLPGISSGADEEVAEAERLGIPVFHSFEELQEALNCGNIQLSN